MSRQATAGPVPRLSAGSSTPVWLLAGLAVGGTGLGIALAALGVRFGTWVPLAVAVLLVVVVGGLARPCWAVGLVFAAIPVGAVSTGPLGIPIIQVAVLGCAALVVLTRVAAGRAPLPWPSVMWWAAAIVGVAVLETPLAISRDAAVRQVAQLVTGVLITLGIVAAVRRIDDVRWLAGVLVVVGTVVCLLALPGAGQLRPSYGGAVVENRAQGLFTEPNQLGSFSALLLFCACALWLGGRTGRVRAGGGLSALVALAALVLSLSRGSWIGAVTGLAVLLATLPLARRRLLLLAPVAAGVFLVLVALRPGIPQLGVVTERLESLSNPTASPWDDRPGIYREAWNEVQDRPLTGFGPGGFRVASSRAESDVRAIDAFHAHNVLLTVAAEAGTPAVLLLVGFTLSVGVVALRAIRRLWFWGRPRDAALVACLAAALMMVVGQGLVDFTLRNPIIIVVVWSVLGLLLAADRVTRAQAAP
jgi:O-antigen ligase